MVETLLQNLLTHKEDPCSEIESVRGVLIDWALSHQSYNEVSYNRRVICSDDQGNEIVLACWKRGHTTPFHGHPNQSCWVTVVKGELKEVRIQVPFEIQPNLVGWKEFQKVYQLHDQWSFVEASKTMVTVNSLEWNYIDDKKGFHCVEALSDETISLHVYRNL